MAIDYTDIMDAVEQARYDGLDVDDGFTVYIHPDDFEEMVEDTRLTTRGQFEEIEDGVGDLPDATVSTVRRYDVVSDATVPRGNPKVLPN